jgi:hypothetical protein
VTGGKGRDDLAVDGDIERRRTRSRKVGGGGRASGGSPLPLIHLGWRLAVKLAVKPVRRDPDAPDGDPPNHLSPAEPGGPSERRLGPICLGSRRATPGQPACPGCAATAYAAPQAGAGAEKCLFQSFVPDQAGNALTQIVRLSWLHRQPAVCAGVLVPREVLLRRHDNLLSVTCS